MEIVEISQKEKANRLPSSKIRLWHYLGEFLCSMRAEILAFFFFFMHLSYAPKIAPGITALVNLLGSKLTTENQSFQV